jgi:hypothetical protein
VNRRDLLRGLAFAAFPLAARAQTSDAASLVTLARKHLALHQDIVKNTDRCAIADFSVHSASPRFHLIDMEAGKIETLLVAHGKGSDPAHTGWLKSFSNAVRSEATSQGAYLTADSYSGKHGLSRRLTGLDPDNSNALDRGIVIHSAWYVSEDLASKGTIGRSQGCFAFSEIDHPRIMDRLGPGRLLTAARI